MYLFTGNVLKKKKKRIGFYYYILYGDYVSKLKIKI